MKTKKNILISGFAPLLCMALMMLFQKVSIKGDSLSPALFLLWQTLPFVLPAALLIIVAGIFKTPVAPPMRITHRRYTVFIICISIATALFALLINCLLAFVVGGSYYQTVSYIPQLEGHSFILLLAAIVLPAVLEELFFRGLLMRALSGGGEIVSIIISAICFAMCHGDLHNFLGPLTAGLIYGYMVYALGSVWPAVVAHLINNLFNMLIGYLTKAYEALGLWPYFLIIAAALLFIFIAISMTTLEKLVEKGKIKRLAPVPSRADLVEIVCTPGIWALVILFIIRVCYKS